MQASYWILGNCVSFGRSVCVKNGHTYMDLLNMSRRVIFSYLDLKVLVRLRLKSCLFVCCSLKPLCSCWMKEKCTIAPIVFVNSMIALPLIAVWCRCWSKSWRCAVWAQFEIYTFLFRVYLSSRVEFLSEKLQTSLLIASIFNTLILQILYWNISIYNSILFLYIYIKYIIMLTFTFYILTFHEIVSEQFSVSMIPTLVPIEKFQIMQR